MTCIEKSTGRADNESVFCNLTPAPMHDFKPVESVDCALHTEEEQTNIKEKHGMFCHLNDGKREADLFVSEEKVVLDSTGLVAENDYITNGAKDSDELDSPAFMDNSLKHIENEDECSPLKDDKGVIFNFNAHKTTEEVLFESDIQDRDRLWKSPEYESFMIDNSGDYEVRSGISGAESASEFSHLDADKHIMEPEFPESIACYKESNSNDVKDICIDEGVPIVDKNLIENPNDSSFGTCVSLPPIGDKNNNLGEDVQKEMLSGDPSKIQDAKIGAANESVAPDCLISSMENNVNKESATDTYLEDLMKLFGSKLAKTGKVDNDVSEKQSFGNKPLLELLCAQQHSQSSEEAILESHAPVPTNVESNNENDHSTFDLNNSKAATSDESAENISKQVLDSDAMPKNEDGISDKTSAAPASEVQCRNTVKTAENSCGHPLGPELQDTHNSEEKASANFSIGGHDQFADGEASFSSVGPMSGLITYSGLIPHSGNISLRSDSSTTSARSFAFPVLQSEWNSSPVRMAKGDRRYRKNRGWMQGLLCCRF